MNVREAKLKKYTCSEYDQYVLWPQIFHPSIEFYYQIFVRKIKTRNETLTTHKHFLSFTSSIISESHKTEQTHSNKLNVRNSK